MTDPICVHEGCGGCRFQGVPYAEQLAAKDGELRRLVADKGIDCEDYLEIAGSPRVFAYRSKMEYSFGDERPDGPTTLGMHRRKSFMSVVTTDQCLLTDADFNRILAAVLAFSNERAYRIYHRKSHVGFLRNLVVRKGARTGELLVNLVTSSQSALDREAFADTLLALQLDGHIVGILHTVTDTVADSTAGGEFDVLYGRDFYLEEIMGLKFKVSAFAFFQTNIEAVERLYRTVISWLPALSRKRVFDLYCGAGTIAQAVAGEAGEVTGVEIVAASVAAARENTKLNGLENCRFIEGDVLAVLDGMDEKPDVILLDPPRAGVHPAALRKIAGFRAQTIAYISCNPASLTDNLRVLGETYAVKRMQAFDNFPFTGHTEAAALLERK